MGDELETVVKYLQNNLDIKNNDNRDFYEKFSRFYKNIKKTERPDLYIELENQVVAIEHFQFDASNLLWGKSSSDQKKEAENNKKFNEEFRKLKSGSMMKHDERDLEYNLENYINNFKRNFTKHYSNIDIYKERIINQTSIQDEENVIIIFFVEDKTPLGSYYLTESGKIPLTIFKVEEILKFLKQHPEVDYIFNGYYNSQKNKTVAAKNNLETINICAENVVDFDKCSPLFFNPKEIRFGSVFN